MPCMKNPPELSGILPSVIPYYLPFPEFDSDFRGEDPSTITTEGNCKGRKDTFKTFAFLQENDSPCCWLDEVKRKIDEEVLEKSTLHEK